ncbi:MAG: hypothetical protein HYT61_01435 [Candidatus Yanofskybacteria bacterium]|nr:hypothetical protein [Candidatus Yanofskybacteria bacterium]
MKKDLNKKDKLVTESILERKLKNALEPYVTKDFLKKEFVRQNERNLAIFATKQDLKEGLGGLEEKMNWKFDKLLTASEKIYAKLEKKELEGVVHSYLHKSAEDQLANHDKRITNLEKTVLTQ